MSVEVLYSIISFLVTVVVALGTLHFKNVGKREDKIVSSLDKLTNSLTIFKDINIADHKRIEDKIIITENSLREDINTLDRRVIKVEQTQQSALCPVITKAQV